jgi:predicted 2-oxoglutarate/Fe(II)-dependent dioxygenase YbiX
MNNFLSEKTCTIPSGYYGDSPTNIVVIKNFINQEDLKTIQNFCSTLNNFKDIPKDNWDNRVCDNAILSQISPEVDKILKKYQSNHKKIIEDFFNLELIDNVPSIVIWREGDIQPPHADKEQLDGSPNLYPKNDIASLFYLNDDYEGGEIYFPIQNLQIKPSAGSAVFFPGDRFYQHGVTAVESGKRFTCPAFWGAMKNNRSSV